ncbi:putative toxin-antitoxin system toxin component, PIN family [Thermodesulfobacteriota bacterium]
MNDKVRYVFDTNVIISALLFEQSKPAQAFCAALDRGEILLSRPVLKELNEVLAREKFNPYLHIEERVSFIVALLRESILIDIKESIEVCRDPKDDKFLELAINGGAACIISGDEDLLILNPFRNIPIINPEEFLKSL